MERMNGQAGELNENFGEEYVDWKLTQCIKSIGQDPVVRLSILLLAFVESKGKEEIRSSR